MARILVIDDERSIREMLQEMLELAGHEVEVAPDGTKGVALYMKKKADLVIMDIIMPEKEGIETMIEMKQFDPEVRVIAISGGGKVSANNYLLMAKALGARRTFPKPFECKKMLGAVTELVAG